MPPIPAGSPVAFGITWTVSEPLGTVWPLLFCTVIVLPLGWSVSVAPGKLRCESIAATLMALSPEAGELVM